MSSPFRRPRRRLFVGLTVLALAAPSLPALGAALAPDAPMVASARAGAERARAPITVGTTVSAPPSEAAALAAEVVRLTNLERVAAGRSALSDQPVVASAAAAHSVDQAARQRMDHAGSDGSDAGTRLTRAGFVWRAWGENVAVGQRTAQEVVTAWMNSAGHRSNMLSSSYTKIGIAVATGSDGRRYWTMVLAA